MQSRISKLLSAAVATTLGFAALSAHAQPRPDVVKRVIQNHAGTAVPQRPGAGGPPVRPSQAIQNRAGAPVPQRPGADAPQALPNQAIAARVQAARGAGPNRDWYQGGRMPGQYRTHHYVVNDWRGHRLSAPPRGHHWVQNGSDYLLVAIATGVITSVILNNAY